MRKGQKLRFFFSIRPANKVDARCFRTRVGYPVHYHEVTNATTTADFDSQTEEEYNEPYAPGDLLYFSRVRAHRIDAETQSDIDAWYSQDS